MKEERPNLQSNAWSKVAIGLICDVVSVPVVCVIEVLIIYAILGWNPSLVQQHLGCIISHTSIVSGYFVYFYDSPAYLKLLKRSNRLVNSAVLFVVFIVLGAGVYFAELQLYSLFAHGFDSQTLVVFRIVLIFDIMCLRGWYDVKFKATPFQNIVTWYLITWLLMLPWSTNVLLNSSFSDPTKLNSFLSVAGMMAAFIFAAITKLGSLSYLKWDRHTFAFKTTLLVILVVIYYIVSICFTLIYGHDSTLAQILANQWTNVCGLWCPELICGRRILPVFRARLALGNKKTIINYALITGLLTMVMFWVLWVAWHFIVHPNVVQIVLQQKDNSFMSRNDSWMAFSAGNALLLWNDMTVFSKQRAHVGEAEILKPKVKYPVESLLEGDGDEQ